MNQRDETDLSPAAAYDQEMHAHDTVVGSGHELDFGFDWQLVLHQGFFVNPPGSIDGPGVTHFDALIVQTPDRRGGGGGSGLLEAPNGPMGNGFNVTSLGGGLIAVLGNLRKSKEAKVVLEMADGTSQRGHVVPVEGLPVDFFVAFADRAPARVRAAVDGEEASMPVSAEGFELRVHK